MSSKNDAEKKASQINVRILDSNNDLIIEIKINNEMMKEECAAIKTNEKMIKENWKFCV